MARNAASAVVALAFVTWPLIARAVDPGDFQGRWTVTRMVGAADVGTAEDFHKLPGSTVIWDASRVVDADGTCRIVHASVAPVPTDELQHSIWGGQTIAGLMLPKTVIAKAFGKSATPVFDGGGKDCARAVMLNYNQLLLMFENGYLYLLDRKSER